MATTTLRYLSPAQVAGFQRDGFLVLDQMLSADELEILRSSVDVLDRWAQTHRHEHFAIEPEGRGKQLAIRKIQAIHRHGGAPWAALMTKTETLGLFEDILGPEIRFHHSKLMMKPPFDGSAKHWHQDLSEGFIARDEIERLIPLGDQLPPDHAPVVAIQYYLDDSNVENGCLDVVPGSHRRGLHFNPLGAELIDRNEIVQAKVPAGGALLFHCLTYHASAPNTSRFKRRAPVYEYFAPTEQVALLPRQYDYGRSVRSATTT